MGKKLGEALLGMMPSAAGSIFGIAMQGANDRRQMRQQERLQNLQLQGNKQMLDWQKEKELEMWKATSYPAQMAMMKEAGINPGLMYGMGGGGGTTVGGGSGSVSGGSAPVGGGEMGMGLQAGMMQAQIEVMKSQARKNNVEADKTGGVDTENVIANTGNVQADTKLKQIQARILKIDEWVKGKTADDTIDAIGWQAEKVMQEVEQLRQLNLVGNETMDEKTKLIEQELVGKVLTNLLTGAQTSKTYSDIEVNKAQISKMAADIQQRWAEMDIKTFEAEIKANFPSIFNVAGKVATNVWEVLDRILGEKNLKNRNLNVKEK